MWSRLLGRSQLTLASGPRGHTRPLGQELAHFALGKEEGRTVLWCDGDHGFNPYDFAELNLERGRPADWGAARLLVKRCMTPFQWDTVLTRHLEEKLMAVDASLVMAAPYEDLFSTDELTDWEREDYIDYSLAHLKDLARRFAVPVVILVDMARWCAANPLMAWKAFEAADARWVVEREAGGLRAFEVGRAEVARSPRERQRALSAYIGETAPTARAVLAVVPAAGAAAAAAPAAAAAVALEGGA
jgi:hypothetical protein